jgi:hypothetical protein
LDEAATLRTGQFEIAPGKLALGELRIAGRDTRITLRHEEPFVGKEDDLHLTGTLYDRSHVTLVHCVRLSWSPGGHNRTGSAVFFPHFVVEGKSSLNPREAVIRQIHFTFEDAYALFYDFDAFGSVSEPASQIADLVKSNEAAWGRSIPIGPDPRIVYFTGRTVMVDVATKLGQIRVQHAPGFSVGGPRGVRIDNQIGVSLAPDQPLELERAADAILVLLRFFALAVGRAQVLPQFFIETGTPESIQTLHVHWSHFPQRASDVSDRAPHPADVLFDPIHRPEEFSEVLSAWLALDKARSMARVRAHESFVQGDYYTADRLVGIANAFDQLPTEAVPTEVDLPDNVREAHDACKRLFKKLPLSIEREALLNALGRLGKAALKHKIRHRLAYITHATGDRFADLPWVCDQAVEARNFLVHGSRGVDFPLEGPSNAIGFLTDALEFVFLASELIECGWDINHFLSKGTTQSHPFGRFCVNYSLSLNRFRESVVTRDSEDEA